MRLASKSDKH